MSFIPEQQYRSDLTPQDLSDSHSLMNICPDLEWEPWVTQPLWSGDCTFHHGRTPHRANANNTNDPRVAHVVIFVDESTTYEKGNLSHPMTDDLALSCGEPLPDAYFPTSQDIIAGTVR